MFIVLSGKSHEGRNNHLSVVNFHHDERINYIHLKTELQRIPELGYLITYCLRVPPSKFMSGFATSASDLPRQQQSRSLGTMLWQCFYFMYLNYGIVFLLHYNRMFLLHDLDYGGKLLFLNLDHSEKFLLLDLDYSEKFLLLDLDYSGKLLLLDLDYINYINYGGVFLLCEINQTTV